MQETINDIFKRNYGVLSKEEQSRLGQAKVTVIGAGGVGGVTLISLARMGFGHIRVVDMDHFDYSNINRQMLSSVSRVGKSKAECAYETLIDINPHLQLDIVVEKMVEDNACRLIADSDVVIDATDNLVSRVILHRAAQASKIPSVWIAVTPPFRGGVMTFSEKTPPYELVLRHPSYQKPLTAEVCAAITEIKHQRAKNAVTFGALADWAEGFVAGEQPWAVIAPIANIVGILASFEALKVVLKRNNLPPTWAPQLVRVDLASLDMVKVISSADGSFDNGFL
jgi:molybdopterin/thiamine biosynthesis adenylyltransferase